MKDKLKFLFSLSYFGLTRPPSPGYFLENKFSLKDSFMTLFEFEFPVQQRNPWMYVQHVEMPLYYVQHVEMP